MTMPLSSRERGFVPIIILIVLAVLALTTCDVRHATRQPGARPHTGVLPGAGAGALPGGGT